MRLLLLLALVGAVLWFWRRGRRLPPARRRALLWQVGGGLLVVAVLLLVATGRLPWLAGLLAALVPLARVALRLALPWLASRAARRQPPPGGGSQRPPPATSAMSRDEALSALGLAAGASRDEIVAAHRRLMQRVHPDRGGSDYLAARINLAKETLLGKNG